MPILLYDLVGRDTSRPFSPHCWKTRMSLAHKGLDFECIPTPFTAVPKVDNGTTTVPVIRDGDQLVADSFAIAEYLDATYPDRPLLFGSPDAKAMCRFVEAWSQQTIHPFLGSALLMDIHDSLDDADQVYFRTSREARMGKPLEEMPVGRDAAREAFLPRLNPLRTTFQRQAFLGGETPNFADYIVFGAFQWARIISNYPILPADDAVALWFERCLDLHGGAGRAVPAQK
jgi:glutathione S-transferase